MAYEAVRAWPDHRRLPDVSSASRELLGVLGPRRTTSALRYFVRTGTDAGAIIVAAVLGRLAWNGFDPTFRITLSMAAFLAAGAVGLLLAQGGYHPLAYVRPPTVRSLRGLMLAILGSVVLVDVTREVVIAQRSSLLAFGAVLVPALLAVPSAHLIAASALRSSAFESRVIIVGAGLVADRLEARLERMSGVSVVGRVDDRASATGAELGTLADLSRLCKEFQVDRVLVAFSRTPSDLQIASLRAAAATSQVSIVPRLYEMMTPASRSDDLDGIPLVHIGSHRRSRAALAGKRALDIIGSGILLIVFAPVLAAVAVAIKLSNNGPVFFRQNRTGLDGKVFSIWKFRTMEVDAERGRDGLAYLNESDGPIFKIRNDPRVFPVGRFLRRTSLDELPQLFNVLAGSMSLVGPRPLPVAEAAQIAPSGGVARTAVKPGITGLWQICGRSLLTQADLEHLDAAYAAGWSLTWDLQILLKTPECVLRHRGAY